MVICKLKFSYVLAVERLRVSRGWANKFSEIPAISLKQASSYARYVGIIWHKSNREGEIRAREREMMTSPWRVREPTQPGRAKERISGSCESVATRTAKSQWDSADRVPAECNEDTRIGWWLGTKERMK